MRKKIYKYGFVIPYYKRADQFYNALFSFKHFYSQRDDYYLIVVEDKKNAEDAKEHKLLVDLIAEFQPHMEIDHMISDVPDQVNPCASRNQAAIESKCVYLIQTSPEVCHKVDVLAGFDQELFTNMPENFGPGHPQWDVPSKRNRYLMGSNKYVVCACEHVIPTVRRVKSFDDIATFKHGHWLVHTQKNNRRLHFCSAIGRRKYFSIGGFSEEFTRVYGYDDDDFLRKIVSVGLDIIDRDDLITAHISHSIDHQADRKRYDDGIALLKKKWDYNV